MFIILSQHQGKITDAITREGLLLRGRGLNSAEGISDISAASVTHDPVMHIVGDNVLALLAFCCRSATLVFIICWFDNLHKIPLHRDAVGLNDYITFSSLTKERTKNLPSIVAP